MIYITDQPHLSGPNKEVKTWHMFCYPRAVQLMHDMAREACVARVQFVEAAGKMPSYHVDEQQRLLLFGLGVAEAGLEQAYKVGQAWSICPAPAQPTVSTEGGDWKPGDLDDESPMPFGKHKNTPLAGVPADYLLWFLEQDWAAEKWPGLYRYVTKNRKRLVRECPDHVDN